MKILVATGNPGKLRDFAALGHGAALVFAPLPNFASLPPIEETGDSFEANARLKAEHYSSLLDPALAGCVLADDSGLQVAALGGAPGIYSARFAGRHGDDDANNRLLLQRLHGLPPDRRAAEFVCVLALARAGQTLATFTGRLSGHILDAPRGTLGFGYDPLFLPADSLASLAELPASAKAAISHRGRAARALLEWLQHW